MKNAYQITAEHNENPHVAETLNKNLKQFNESIIGSYDPKPFSIFATNTNNEIIGGIKGDVFGQLCRVYTVWVHESYRGKKLGTELFQRLDDLAKDENCKIVQLDTTEFQAKGFYEKMGYAVVATLPNNFMGYTSYILRKDINLS